jgi:hypothetical protein
MGPKLLFILGIIVAHGALAASWAHQEVPKTRNSIATCVQAPEDLPNFAPPKELLARADLPVAELEVHRP